MLGLSCLPCGDGAECSIKAPAQISSASNHEKHNHKAEHCTPFCTCSCCASTVTYQPGTEITLAVPESASRKYSIYHSSFCPEIAFAIWQPPKIS